MHSSVVTWSQDMSSLGTAAVAIGVFDGVHTGHQALLRDTVADAHERGIRSVAVTFDRDPDQVVSPSTAAPQLLTLAEKLECITDTGIDTIVVVPFTPMLAEMAPESFVDSVLLSAMRPVIVHVGRDFRFGARATGDVATLERLGLARGFAVDPHDLVDFAGSPVTSTRIRTMVAEGDVTGAAELLCRKPVVTGTVHRGRGEGVKLGFPTANIVPVPYAALPANGVYAGRAILEDGVEWAAAISVGTPPTFPEARDYLEAHLVDFEGDLYDETITLEFWEKLRDQQAYGSLDELTEAIAADVDAALEIAGWDDDEDEDDDEHVADDAAEYAEPAADTPGDAFFASEPLNRSRTVPQQLDDDANDGYQRSMFLSSSDEEVVFDMAALEAAEKAARNSGRTSRVRNRADELVVLVDDMPYDHDRLVALDAALRAADIEPVWSPYPPAEAPLLRLSIWGENLFRIEVWNSQLETARAALQQAEGGE